MTKMIWGLLLFLPHAAMANTLLALNDDQFKRLLGMGIPDECVKYYLGDAPAWLEDIDELKVIDMPGHAARRATAEEKQATSNKLLSVLEGRCYQDVKRVIVTNNFYKDMPKNMHADDFSDPRVLDRYVKLIGIDD